MDTRQDNESLAASQAADPKALVAGALLALLLRWSPRTDADAKTDARFAVLQFLQEYPAIAAAIQMRDAGMRVMLASAHLGDDTVLSTRMVAVLNTALEAAGAWDEQKAPVIIKPAEAQHG